MRVDICDVCGTQKDVNRRQYTTGHIDSSAGLVPEISIYDLCLNHELEAIQEALDDVFQINYPTKFIFNTYMVNAIKSLIKEREE